MDDYIERQAAIDAMSESLKRVFPEHRQIAEKCLNALPSAQPKIIRCKDCIHHAYDEIFSCYWCEHPGMAGEVKPDFYCAYGEKGEE